MPPSTCPSCRSVLQLRLRQHIASLQSSRRSFHPTSQYAAPALKSWYWETSPPSDEQLAASLNFFRTHPPRKLWTATEWRKQNPEPSASLTPEVAFLGRSNVGKSSLLNALLLSEKLNHVGARPGKTTTMHAWGLSASDPVTGGAVKGMGGDLDMKLAVLDMPGYGHASHDDWGEEIVTYLRRRKQLRRVFLLLDAVHGVKKSDEKMIDLLRSENIPHQIIASKCDRVGSGAHANAKIRTSLEQMRTFLERRWNPTGILNMGEIIAVGALGDGRKNESIKRKDMEGVEEVQWAVLRATGLEDFATKKMKTTSSSSIASLQAAVQIAEPHPPAPSSQAEKILQQALLDLAGAKRPHQPRKDLVHPPPSKLPFRRAPPKSRPYEDDPFRDESSRSPQPISRPTPPPPPARTPTPIAAARTTTPTSPGKWTPNVGGMAELLAMTSSKPKHQTRQSGKPTTTARAGKFTPNVGGMADLLAMTGASGADKPKSGKGRRRRNRN